MKQILLTQNKFALVDDSDFVWLNKWKWFASEARIGKFYAMKTDLESGSGKRVNCYMHRVIMGCKSRAEHVDHRDGNGLNNQRANLRIANGRKNSWNQVRSKDNTSGYKGVHRDRKKWRAILVYGGEKINLGSFAEKKEAAKAYDRAARQHYGEFACTNF